MIQEMLFAPSNIISYILTTIGMFILFKKCGLDCKQGIIPYFRYYTLAKYADHKEDGLISMLAMIISDFTAILVLMIPDDRDYRVISLLVLLISIIFYVMKMVYQIRICSDLCRVFGRKRIWVILWVFFPELASIIWGVFHGFQPVNKKKKGQAAGMSGAVAEVLDEGLTINITDRTTGSFFHKKCLLRDIHMNIQPGRMVLLLGGSGAGKTTFINAVTGYEKANASITLNGEDVYRDFDKLKYDIGMVPQQDLVRYNDTVERTLLDMATLRLPTIVSRKELEEKVDNALHIFGLTPVKDNLVAKQSGGQKKRISIASEFISDPFLFILDEPDSGLDGILARELMERLHDISREGKIVIVITHTPDRVIDLFDDVIVLAKDKERTGRLVFYGPMEEAKEFFETDKMEKIIRMINREDEGGEGRADQLIEKYAEVYHGRAN